MSRFTLERNGASHEFSINKLHDAIVNAPPNKRKKHPVKFRKFTLTDNEIYEIERKYALEPQSRHEETQQELMDIQLELGQLRRNKREIETKIKKLLVRQNYLASGMGKKKKKGKSRKKKGKSRKNRKTKGGFFNFFKKGCDKYHISERIADKNGCKKDKNCYYEDRGSQGSFCFKKKVKKGKKSRKKGKRKGGRRTRRRRY